jgi:radical SAM superfamily enzyme YgiQ (UPF0313 family)
VRALLISTYDLGRQPFGLASPAAWLRAAGVEVECVDTSRAPLEDDQMASATFIAFYLPMHTATRLAAPLIDRARRLNPSARLCAYGLYAPLNAQWLGERGITDILGPEAEAALVDLVKSQLPTPNSQFPTPNSQLPTPNSQLPEPKAQSPKPKAHSLPRLHFITPDRAGLPALERYASLRMPDGSRRIMGSTDATRGCKHFCRHCPIVPVYHGQFRVVPLDVVMDDIRAQVAAGAQHISFGDPDFLNGPTHAHHLVERIHVEFPDISYDVTIKIEHLLEHADMIPLLRDSGCLFITSAVEAADDFVLEQLRKGHTRGDFVSVAALCRDAGVTLVPTFVPFTPWTTLAGYVDLLELLEELDLVEHVAPIQLAIRLLVTAGSPLLDLPEVRTVVAPFDPGSLTWPWRHHDVRVDALQTAVMQLVGGASSTPRPEVFGAISALAREHAGLDPTAQACAAGTPGMSPRSGPVPYASEPWYCCAEPLATL